MLTVLHFFCFYLFILNTSESQQVICATRRSDEIIVKVSTQPELRECKSVSGFSRETRFGSKSSKAQNQIGHQMTIRGREASSSTSGSETSSDRRSETSLHGSELSLEENQDDSVFSSNLVDQTSNLVDLTSDFVDLTFNLVDQTSNLVDLTSNLVDLTSDFVDQTSNQSPADYDLSVNLSHPEEMVVNIENERTTDQVGGSV